MPGKVFVTVGSTRFPGLVKAVLSAETIRVFQDLGYGELCIQYGTDGQLFLDQTKGRSNNPIVTGFDYSASIEKEMQQADLIISHAGNRLVNLFDNEGAGSVLEALHSRKLLVVVPNTTLMDNHQVDVAKALSDQGYLLTSSLEDLPTVLVGLKDNPQLRPFPASSGKRFAQILDEELGLA